MIDTKIKSQKQKMFLESAERTPHYGIRKFTVGVASALLSTTLWLGSAPSAQAATTGTGDVATSQTNNTAPAGQATEMQSQTEASAPAQSTAPAPQNESQKASESQAAGSTSTEAAEQAADSASADAQTEAASAQVKNQAPASTEASTDQVTTEAASQSSSSAHEKVAETQTQTEASTPAQNTAPATQAESQKASESQATASASTSATEQVADSANAQSQVENSTAASTQSEQTAPTAPAETTQATPATALTSGEAVSQKQENAGEAAAQDAQKALENSKETTGSVENTSSDAKANTLPGGVSVDNTVVDEKQASGNSTEKATTVATTTLNVSKLLRTSSFVASPANLAVSLAATNDSLTLYKNSLDSIGEYYYTFRKSVQGKPSITTSDKNWSVHQGKDGSWNIVYTRTFKVSGPNKYGMYNTGDLPAGDVTFTIKNAVHDESGKTYDMKVKLSNVYFKALGYKTNDSLIYNGKSVSWTVVDFTKDGYVWFRSGMGAAQSDGLYGNYRSGGRNDGKIGTRFDATVQVVGASTNNSKNAMPIYFRDLDQPDKTEGGEDHKAYLNEDGNVKRYTEKIQFLSGMIGNAHANTNSVVKEKGNTFYGLQELSDSKGSPDIEKGEFDQLVTADKFSFHWAASDAGTRVFANYGDHEITTTFVSGHNQGKYTHTGGNLDTVYMKRDRTVTVTPNSGYYIKSILVDGKEYLKNPGSTSNTSAVTVTFNNVTADHNVKTDIRKIPATDSQDATVIYHDDYTNTDLESKDLSGKSNADSGYNTKATISKYEGMGYKLVSDDTGGKNVVFDNDANVDQEYVVHLTHDKRESKGKDTDVVSRTIHYVVNGGSATAPADVHDSLNFTATVIKDAVTGDTISIDWEGAKDFKDVTSPTLQGYSVDRQVVSNTGVYHDWGDIYEVVTYRADTQKAHVKYVDDTDNKTLKTDDLQGESDTTAYKDGKQYLTADSIKGYVGQGYKLVSDSTNGESIMLDHVTGTDQYYEVHFVHDTYTKAVADDVHRTITYVVHGGNHSAPAPVGDNLHFTGVQTYDKVNNNLLRTDWEPNKDFADVTSPEIKGYTVDREVVINHDIEHNHADIKEVVTYTAEKQYAHVKYVDDTDSKTLKTDDMEGESDTTAYKDGVPYTTAASIKDYISQGYKLVSDNTDGATIMLDHLTGVDQFYEVHLVHDTYTKDVADDVHRTVHYVVKGGNHAAPEDVEADLHFTGVQTWDKVTNGLLKTDWEPNKDFTDVDTPEIQGYTADRLIVSNRDISHDHADILEVVTYTADKQRAHVRYHDDTDNRDLKTVDLEGDSDTLASLDGKPYTTEWQINYYIDRGYAKVSDDTNGMTIMLDHVTGTDQYYNVHLVHTYQTITPKNPGDPNKPINPKGDPNPVWPPDTGAKDLQHDVLRNIHYIVDGGMDKAPDDVNDLLHFEETRVYDKVNGKLISDEWSPKQDFKDITSPAITGYTVDREVVINHDIEHNHADIKEVVHYVPDPQKAFVTYIDHTTGDTLAIKELDGKTHAHSGYTTYSSIVYYQGLGYQFISDTTDGKEIVYDNDDKVDQYYTVYLEHSYVPASPQNPGKPGEPINQNPDGAVWPDGTDANSLQHDVNRTINYVVTGGKDKAPDSVSDKLHFEAVAMVDRVTGEIVSTKWDEDKDFSDVTSPEIKGYTVDRKVVSNKDIEHNAKDIVETVTYNPDAQKASVTYIDKTTGKTLKTDKLDGVTHADSGYNTKGAIAVYQGLGYALVSDTTGGTNVIFDNDDAVDQAFTVTLEHTYVTVTPKDQIKEGTPINQGKGSATYTEGATPEALQHDVKRNIHYVVSNGKKAAPADVNDILHYEASAVIDKVTGDVVKTTWSGNQDFKDVASPDLKGYTVDKTLVSNKNISHDHADIKEVVTYAADPQKASVTYIDDTTGKNLDIKVLKGFTLDDSGYNTKSDIKGYVDLGYDLVSDSSNGAEIIFDDEDGVDQAYTVHLAHGKITVTEEKPGKPGEPINPGEGSADWPDGTDKGSLGKDVVRTITYKMVDGSKAPEGTSQTLHFTASKVIDKVTGQVLETTWSGTQDFKDVESPSVKGYTPDQKVISDKGITHEHSNIDEVVTYVPDPQKALVTYYDDTNGKVLKADSLVGVTNKDSGYTTKGSIAGYINLGFKLVSDETGGKSIVFDNDDSHDQAYSVHLAHDYITVTPEEPGKPGQPINPDANGPKYPGDTDVKGLTDIVNREMDYVMSDGSKAPAAVKDSLSFTAKKTIDKATGEVVKTEWSANQDFKDVESPQVAGYTADTKTVSNKDIAHDAADIKVVVKYTADAQKAAVTYIDDNTGKSLKVDNLDGVTNAKSGYTTKSAIDTYTSLGYTLVSDDTNGAEVVFDNDDKVDQAFTVHFSHGTITVTTENPGKPGEPINPGKGSANWPEGTDKAGLTKTVTRTISYKVAGDKDAAPEGKSQTLTFTAEKTVDNVTGQVTETKWSANQDFDDVETPALTGYTADKKVVSDKNIAHDHENIATVVTYNPDAQKGTVTYVDSTTGKSLKTDALSGFTHGDSGYKTADVIKSYTDKGYTLVSDTTNGTEVVFDNDDSKDQGYTVTFKHGSVTVTADNPGKPGEEITPGSGVKYPEGTDKAGLTKTVSRTITYKMEDGSKAPDPVTQTLTFTATKTIDTVTGEVTETKWSGNQDFPDVTSPTVAGYTPDTATASAKGVAYDAGKVDTTITYKADAQKATVKYVDSDGTVIETKELTGVSNGHSGYSTISKIKELENKGYVLVSDDTTGSEIVFDTDDAKDQAYTVSFKHGTTTVTADNPKNPVTGLDDSANLIKKVHQTIKYVKVNGKRAAKSNVQTLTFKRNETIDAVTGKVLSYSAWDEPKSTKAVTSPKVKGFTASKKTVGAKSYKASDSDKVITVTYSHLDKAVKKSKKSHKKSSGKMINGGSGTKKNLGGGANSAGKSGAGNGASAKSSTKKT